MPFASDIGPLQFSLLYLPFPPFFRLSFAIIGSGKFHFDYADNHQERVLVIEGEAELTPDDGAAKIIISAGDYVVFHQGFACGQ